MKPSDAITVLRAALAGGLLSLAIGSCGRAADGEEELQIDSNTNWLMRCESDAQCSGSLRCFCGQCSQPCASTQECGLLAGAECAPTSGAVCGEQPTAVGGLCVLGCREDAECGSDFSCTANQCLPKPCVAVFQSWDDVLEMVAADLRRLDSNDGPFARYISLANHASYAACDGTLSRERHAINKLLNSLSREPTVALVTPVDPAETLYRIDLRDYDWDREIRIGAAQFQNVWAGLAANNPLAVRFVGEDAAAATARAADAHPVMLADSLIATATRPDVYAPIVGVPNDYQVLLAQLGIDRQDRQAGRIRAGFVEEREYVASHWQTNNRLGYLWEIADVAGPAGALFDDPLGTPVGERAIIYTLPNGFQAFAFVGADSRWLADSDVVLDINASNLRATAPLSLMRQHSPRVNVRDEVRNHVLANPHLFDPEGRAAILEQYVPTPDLEALLAQEAETLVLNAWARAQVPSTLAEPISASVDAYQRDLTLEDVAGELLIAPDELLENLALLDPAFAVLDGGSMDRIDFELLFHQALCTLTVVNENLPAPDLCL